MDEIHLEELKFHACHGVEATEKSQAQLFIVTVILRLDLSKAAVSDSLDQTVNYAEAYALVKKIMEGKSVNLMEHLAYQLITALHHQFSLHEVELFLSKPSPPMLSKQKAFTIRLKRKKSEL